MITSVRIVYIHFYFYILSYCKFHVFNNITKKVKPIHTDLFRSVNIITSTSF